MQKLYTVFIILWIPLKLTVYTQQSKPSIKCLPNTMRIFKYNSSCFSPTLHAALLKPQILLLYYWLFRFATILPIYLLSFHSYSSDLLSRVLSFLQYSFRISSGQNPAGSKSSQFLSLYTGHYFSLVLVLSLK